MGGKRIVRLPVLNDAHDYEREIASLFPSVPVPPGWCKGKSSFQDPVRDAAELFFGGRPWPEVRLENDDENVGYYYLWLTSTGFSYYFPCLLWHAANSWWGWDELLETLTLFKDNSYHLIVGWSAQQTELVVKVILAVLKVCNDPLYDSVYVRMRRVDCELALTRIADLRK